MMNKKPKILITDKIHDNAIALARTFSDVTLDFGCSPSVLVEKIKDFDALIVRSGTKVTRDVIMAGTNLKVIGRAGAGLDNIDCETAKEKGIIVVNSPESTTKSVSELVFGSLLCLMRNISKGDKSLRNGRWERSEFTGNLLNGKTIGIVGFGRIGQDIGKKARAFGMNILVFDPKAIKEIDERRNIKYAESLDYVLENSDIITLHVPLIPATKDLINSGNIPKLKLSSVIVNMARGGVVNEVALFNALKRGKIKGACIDVFSEEPPVDSPFLSLDNVILTPHLGASTYEGQESAGTIVVEKIRKKILFFEDKEREKKTEGFKRI